MKVPVEAPGLLGLDPLLLVLHVDLHPLLLLAVDQVNVLLHALHLHEDHFHLFLMVFFARGVVLMTAESFRQRICVDVGYVAIVPNAIVPLSLLVKQPLDLFICLLSEVGIHVVLLDGVVGGLLFIAHLLDLPNVPHVLAPVILGLLGDLAEHQVYVLIRSRVDQLAIVDGSVFEVSA